MKRVKGNRGRKRVPTFTAAASLCLVDEWLSFSLASSSRSDPTSFSATSAARWAPPTWVWSVARSDWAVDHSERSTDSSSVAAVRLDWRHSLSEVTSLNSTLKLCRERERGRETVLHVPSDCCTSSSDYAQIFCKAGKILQMAQILRLKWIIIYRAENSKHYTFAVSSATLTFPSFSAALRSHD